MTLQDVGYREDVIANMDGIQLNFFVGSHGKENGQNNKEAGNYNNAIISRNSLSYLFHR